MPHFPKSTNKTTGILVAPDRRVSRWRECCAWWGHKYSLESPLLQHKNNPRQSTRNLEVIVRAIGNVQNWGTYDTHVAEVTGDNASPTKHLHKVKGESNGPLSLFSNVFIIALVFVLFLKLMIIFTKERLLGRQQWNILAFLVC
jgi:hypothetical protein